MSIAIEIIHPRSPGDVSGLLESLRRLPINRIQHLVVLGKTEGPATLNDFSRELAQSAVDETIKQVGGASLLERTTRLFSTGVEGIATPLTAVFAEIDENSARSLDVGFAFGTAKSRPLPDGERAGAAHVEAARETVAHAMAEGKFSADQVALVLIKSPILSMAEAVRRGGDRLRHGGSTGSSRGAATLGAGLALNEVNALSLGSDPVGRTNAYAQRVMAFSGTEVDRIEAVVFGRRPGGDPRWDIASALVKDIADGDSMRRIPVDDKSELLLVLLKAGISRDGTLRGKRTTVLTSDLPPDKQLRAAASGVVAACFGGADAFISAGAEHLGPPGACLCALIAKRKSAAL